MAGNESPPFDEKAVLFRFVPTDEERQREFLADEYVVLRWSSGHSGLKFLYLYRGNWSA